MSILFYDGVCPKEYTLNTLESSTLGGTEATVLRIAERLVDQNHTVNIAQRHRKLVDSEVSKNLYYISLNECLPYKPNIVITLRDAGHYIANKVKYPNAKHYLWLHDHISSDYYYHLHQHFEHLDSAHIICVSEYHKANLIAMMYNTLLSKQGKFKISVIYNPIASYCSKRNDVIDRNKLVYFSSPHKDLEGVLKLFSMVYRVDPTMRLYLGNPGYLADEKDLPDGVISLGSLPHKEIMSHVSNALCVFYPNTKFPETFGLVYAESNAMGTPVLAHPIGAAREILYHPKETMDCRNYKEVVERVLAWKNGDRPIVSLKKEFTLPVVINEWKKLLL